MKNKTRQLKLRTVLLTALTVALVASAAAVLGASAADSVSPSDVSKSDVSRSDVPKSAVTYHISRTDVSPSDERVAKVTIWNRITGFFAPLFSNEPAENLGDPVITMTTGKGVGETLNLTITGSNLYVDYGDGTPVAYGEGDGTVKGSEIKIYGDGITELQCKENQLTALDVSKCDALTYLNCEWNQLTALDVTRNSALTGLQCNNNQLTSLNVKQNTNLENLLCYNNNLTALDVTENYALTELYCMLNQLSALDVTENPSLTKLVCGNGESKAGYGKNHLSTLNVTNNSALTYLDCHDVQLTSLNVSENSALTRLYCYDNPLSTLDVTNNPALTHLSCDNNQLTSLNIENNGALTELTCGNNQLTALDVTQNNALTYLSCYHNQLTALDVTHNTALTFLSCENNQLTSLDVTQNHSLAQLFCPYNRLTSLDVTQISNLRALECQGNQLTALDLSNNTNWHDSPDVRNNRLKFSTMKGDFTYPDFIAPQAPIEIASSIQSGETIDLSSEYNIDGAITDYVWYDSDGNEVVPTQSQNGVFTFGEEFGGKKLTCKMTNEKFPAFRSTGTSTGADDRLTTTEVTVEGSSPTLGDLVVTMTTGMAVGETLHLENTEGTNIYIDYGDGTPVAYTEGNGTVKGSDIKIYADSLIWLWCNDNQLTDLNVSRATELGGLYCGDNNLTSLDVSNITGLSYLDCRNNRLTELNVENNTALQEIYCWDNQLDSLDVTNNTELLDLFCSNNALTALHLENNTALRRLECYGNQLTALDVTQNTALTELTCSDNQITALDVTQNTALENLICGSNQLAVLDVTQNTALTQLFCGGNELTALDVSHNTELTMLESFNNQLTDLNIANNTKLNYLDCAWNQLTSLDVSNNTALDHLSCYGNQLTSLDVSNNTALQYCNCYDNQMKFSTLTMNLSNITYAVYAPQRPIPIASSIKIGESIDLSSEYAIEGTITQYVWYDADGNEVTPTQATGGVFTFGEEFGGKTLVCKMTNEKFPDFNDGVEVFDPEHGTEQSGRLITTEVTVQAADTTPDDNTPSSDTSDTTPDDNAPSSDTSDTTPDDNTPSAEPSDTTETNNTNNGNNYLGEYKYFPIELQQLDGIGDFNEVKCPEGTTFTVNGRWVVPSDVRLVVGNIETNKKKSVLDAIKRYNPAFDAESPNMLFYEISLLNKKDADVTVHDGRVWIFLKYPENVPAMSDEYVFHLYHQKDDGTVEEVPVTCRPGGIWFGARRFSPYVLYWHAPASGSANTGESSVLIWVMAGLCLLSVAAAGAVVYRKRRTAAE